MIGALLAFLTGGGLRLLPEIVSIVNKFLDNGHELKMTTLQIQLETLKQAGAQAMAAQQIDAQQVIAMLDAQRTALGGQMQKVGIAFVDAMNFLVRPLTTYYFLFIYGFAKASLFIVAVQNGVPLFDAATHIWTPFDSDTLTSILGFWFVGRVFDKAKHGK